MTYEESVEQLESLIEAWQLDEADLNQTDINAMQVLLKENQKLKEQLEKRTKMYQNAYDYSQKMEGKAIILETQQKEFIEYMNKTIEELECDDVDDEELKGYLIQRIDTFKEILSKYKEIIGDDINDKK